MAITTDPDVLFVFNEGGSGTSVPNENTGGSAGTINVHTDGTAQYAWSAVDAGSYNGYLDMSEEQGADLTRIDTAETFASTLADESMVIRFQIQAYDTRVDSKGFLISGATNNENHGTPTILIADPTSTGDFDMIVKMRDNTFSQGTDTSAQTIFQDLSFGTDYAVACSVDRSTPTACVARYKLNSEDEYAPGTSYEYGSTLDTTSARLCCGTGFTNYYGVSARLYYYAYWRGYFISSADLALCNSSPSTTIPLWPAAAGGGPKGALGHPFNGPFGGPIS